MTDRALRLLRYAQGILGLNSGDTLLASFPRSGSTWIRFFLCNLLSLRELDGHLVDFPRLDGTMVELGVSDLRVRWPYEAIPRVVKTHRPYSFLYSRAGRSILVIRDPRDAAVSYYHYDQAKTRPRFQGDLGTFLRHRRFGLESWFRHYRSWVYHADHTIQYEDLVDDARGTFDSLLRALDVESDDATVTEAIERSRFRSVRSIEESRGVTRKGAFGTGFRFARRGGTGGWSEHFSNQDRLYYARLHGDYGIGIYPP